LSSPDAFKNEILLPLMHTGQNFEGWGRPWHYFLSTYLPELYFHRFWIPFILVFLFGLVAIFRTQINRRTKRLLILCSGWFLWNLLAISIVSAKVPNFAYQSVIFGIFFAIYSLILLITNKIAFDIDGRYAKRIVRVGSVLAVALFLYTSAHTINKFKTTRASSYSYISEHEKYYQFGELAQKESDTKDIFILNATADDCWFRYYILFLTGAEARTFDEVYGIADVEDIKDKYNKVYFVLPKTSERPDLGVNYEVEDYGDYTAYVFNTKDLSSSFLDDMRNKVLNPLHLEVNQANRSCEWLMQSEDLFHRGK
jgi:hypothetical protein